VGVCNVNGDHERPVGVVDALLGDRPVRIRVVAGDDGDQMSSVGLPDKFQLKDTLDVIGETAALVYDKLHHLAPTTASVEFGVSFSVQGGKLTALLFDGKADASLTIRLEWESSPGTEAASSG
jgi:hypothetical protein